MKPPYAPPRVEHRRGGDSTKLNTGAAVSRSVAVYRIGGREYPLYSAPQCFTCQSHHRVAIENAILKGYGYKTIAESLPEQAGLSAKNIQDHVANGHLPLEQHVRRALIEDRAKEVGKHLEDATGSLVDHIAFARLGVQQVFEDIAEGRQKVTVRDAIRMAGLLAKTEKEAGGAEGIDNQMVTRAFMAVMNAIEAHTEPEAFEAIADAIMADPVMQALNRAAAGISPDERIIEEPSIRGGGTHDQDD